MKNLLLSVVCFFLSCTALEGTHLYTVQSLGTFEGKSSSPKALNQNGTVLGHINLESPHFFYWNPEQGLKLLGEGFEKDSICLNNNNQIVISKNIRTNGWFSDSIVKKHFLLSDGIEQEISFPEEFTNPSVLAINDQGQILFRENHPPKTKRSTARVFQEGEWTLLDKDFFGLSMNNQGDISGLLISMCHSDPIACIYNLHTKAFLTIGLDSYWEKYPNWVVLPFKISDTRQVIGQLAIMYTYEGVGFTYHPETGMQVLENFLPGAVNNMNQIIGVIKDSKRPAIYENNEAKEIEIDPVSSDSIGLREIVSLHSINDKGQILGQGIFKDGSKHVILLNPASED